MRKKRHKEPVVIPIPMERTPRWCVAARVGFATLLLLQAGLWIANGLGYRLLIGDWGQEQLCFLLNVPLLFCAAASIHFRKKGWYLPVATAAAILLLIYGANIFAYEKDRSYTRFISPAGEHTLIMESDSSMFSGRVRFYQSRGGWLIRYTGIQIALADGYQAFIQQYPQKVEWVGEDLVRITGSANASGLGETIEISF